ncbi:unnamed protein product [Penicillium glandicola]
MPSDNPACAECKAKKKRCIHRNQTVKVAEAEVEAVPASMSPPSVPAVPTPAPTPVPAAAPAPGVSTRGRRKAAEAQPKEASPAPADSSDELSSVPSEAEQKSVVKKTTKRRRAKPAAAKVIPEFPTDSLQAASTMSVHAVWARQLRANLDDLQENTETFNEAHRAVIASTRAIQNTVEGWIQTWAATGR